MTWPIVTDQVARSVGLSVSQSSKPCKKRLHRSTFRSGWGFGS